MYVLVTDHQGSHEPVGTIVAMGSDAQKLHRHQVCGSSHVLLKLISCRLVIELEPIASRRIAGLVPTAPSSATQHSVLRLRGQLVHSESWSR